ncbi:SDR family oxidoreductase [Actinoplanes sp. CA-030573]|uniref:SDR family oxidoreductase n=1 Tax=Actinoplanes sp. CA-030573 TaxID=3239898 RepID=UPI003D942019
MGASPPGKAIDPAAALASLQHRQPIGRLVSATEVAAAIVYLASPASSATTGTALSADGGMQGLPTRTATVRRREEKTWSK